MLCFFKHENVSLLHLFRKITTLYNCERVFTFNSLTTSRERYRWILTLLKNTLTRVKLSPVISFYVFVLRISFDIFIPIPVQRKNFSNFVLQILCIGNIDLNINLNGSLFKLYLRDIYFCSFLFSGKFVLEIFPMQILCKYRLNFRNKGKLKFFPFTSSNYPTSNYYNNVQYSSSLAIY